jgi:hypothetical protein
MVISNTYAAGPGTTAIATRVEGVATANQETIIHAQVVAAGAALAAINITEDYRRLIYRIE